MRFLQNIHVQNSRIDNTVRDEDSYVKAYDVDESRLVMRIILVG